jgi:succinate dehydrogenase / fumarate reductase cytochrome b subunit
LGAGIRDHRWKTRDHKTHFPPPIAETLPACGVVARDLGEIRVMDEAKPDRAGHPWRGANLEGPTMADVKRPARPLSPHLQIYRWQVPMLTSILTRITGNGLIVAVVLAVWWLLAAATSDAYFDLANAVVTSWFGDLVFTAALWAVWYHLLAGLRHLIYDSGRGLDIPTAEKLGWGCLVGSVVLTVITVLLVQ